MTTPSKASIEAAKIIRNRKRGYLLTEEIALIVQQAVDKETQELRELLKVARCPACDGSGTIQEQISGREIVTKEMAMDAGDPSMEGSLYCEEEWEQYKCQWCDERNKILNPKKGTK